MWVQVYSAVFLARTEEDGGKAPIPPFSFEVFGATALLLEVRSYKAPSHWWQAGYCDLYKIEPNLPTFVAQEKWQLLPLGPSLYALPSGAVYRVQIEPRDYIQDLAVKAWVDTGWEPPTLPNFDGGIYG